MTKGYGAETLNLLRGICNGMASGPLGVLGQLPLPLPPSLRGATPPIEFPLTLGRDFAGSIVSMGHDAKGKHGLGVGDEVYGVVGVQRQGAHADYVLTSIDTVSVDGQMGL